MEDQNHQNQDAKTAQGYSRLIEIISGKEAASEQAISQSREETENAIEKFRNDSLEQHDRKVEEIIRSQQSELQRSLVGELHSAYEELSSRSKSISAGSKEKPEERLELSFVYASLCSEQSNSIGIIIPTITQPLLNGARYLNDRLKALTLETLLKAKDEGHVPISKVSMLSDSVFSVFTIDLSKPLTLIRKSRFSSNYDELLLLDMMLEEAFAADPAFSSANIVYRSSDGNLLSLLSQQNLSSIADASRSAEEQQPEESQKPKLAEYVDSREAIDMLFGLSKSQPAYSHRHSAAKKRFYEELAKKGFENFENLGEKASDGKTAYCRRNIEEMLSGDNEEISVSGKKAKIVVKRHYLIPVKDESVMSVIFSFGAYTEEDAKRKYCLTDDQLSYYFEEAGGTQLGKYDKFTLDLKSGAKETFYRFEDLEDVARRRRT